ncbi:hypothetical protein JCM9279_000269 [Rhodotorula babjevae]
MLEAADVNLGTMDNSASGNEGHKDDEQEMVDVSYGQSGRDGHGGARMQLERMALSSTIPSTSTSAPAASSSHLPSRKRWRTAEDAAQPTLSALHSSGQSTPPHPPRRTTTTSIALAVTPGAFSLSANLPDPLVLRLDAVARHQEQHHQQLLALERQQQQQHLVLHQQLSVQQRQQERERLKRQQAQGHERHERQQEQAARQRRDNHLAAQLAELERKLGDKAPCGRLDEDATLLTGAGLCR